MSLTQKSWPGKATFGSPAAWAIFCLSFVTTRGFTPNPPHRRHRERMRGRGPRRYAAAPHSSPDQRDLRPRPPRARTTTKAERRVAEMLPQGCKEPGIGAAIGWAAIGKTFARDDRRYALLVLTANRELEISAGKTAGKSLVLQHVRPLILSPWAGRRPAKQGAPAVSCARWTIMPHPPENKRCPPRHLRGAHQNLSCCMGPAPKAAPPECQYLLYTGSAAMGSGST